MYVACYLSLGFGLLITNTTPLTVVCRSSLMLALILLILHLDVVVGGGYKQILEFFFWVLLKVCTPHQPVIPIVITIHYPTSGPRPPYIRSLWKEAICRHSLVRPGACACIFLFDQFHGLKKS